jgi:hypothetical protein
MHAQGKIENILRSPLYKISDKTYKETKKALSKLS